MLATRPLLVSRRAVCKQSTATTNTTVPAHLNQWFCATLPSGSVVLYGVAGPAPYPKGAQPANQPLSLKLAAANAGSSDGCVLVVDRYSHGTRSRVPGCVLLTAAAVRRENVNDAGGGGDGGGGGVGVPVEQALYATAVPPTALLSR